MSDYEYNLLYASSEREAKRIIDTNGDIDIIIVNIEAVSRDQDQTAEFWNSVVNLSELRTIIITTTEELKREMVDQELSSNDFLLKPVQSRSLRSRIDMHFQLLRKEDLERDLYKQNALFNSVFQQSPIGIAICSCNESFKYAPSDTFQVNRMYEKIIGRTKEELIELGWEQITHPDDLQADAENFKKLVAGEISSYSMEKRYVRPDGSIVWVDMVVAPLHLPYSDTFNYICLIQDITERKAIENALIESERSKSVVLAHLPGLAYRCNFDRNWTMQFVSKGCYDLTGYPPESLLYNRDLSYNDVIAPEYRELLWNEWRRIVPNRLPFTYEYEIVTASGERKWVLETGQGIYDAQGNVEALEGIVLDISDRKKMENELRYNYEHDKLTGLYNRSYLEELLNREAEKPFTENRALVGINLSAIHSLTKLYGFHYSQDLLKKIAETLRRYCNDNISLYRTYENRFVFYLKGYSDKHELINFCEDVVATLKSLLLVERIGAGIGVIEIDENNKDDTDTLLKHLLITTERAIELNEAEIGFCFYDKEIEASLIREEEIVRELDSIAAGSEDHDNCLYLQYQPILDLKTNRISGFEVLARLKSRKYGIISPGEFIPLAEKTKLIVPIGERIMNMGLRFLKLLKENGCDGIDISINISAIQLLRNNFHGTVLEMIDNMRVQPQNVCLEITESIFSSSYDEINRVLGTLKACGISIAIDDFGTGYSSLARERELNVNCIKLDKYFIDKLLTLHPNEAIAGDIISMAHRLGHSVIAEGVEHEIQKQYLYALKCDKIQGYLISRPLDEVVAIEFLKKHIRH